MNVVLVIPTYNECRNISPLVEELEKEFTLISPHKISILIVDDFSSDGTPAAVKNLMGRFNNLFLLEGKKEGLGSAYLRGITHAISDLGAEVIVQMDADFSHDPSDVKRLLAEIDKGYDLVIGSRYIKGGSVSPNWGVYRKALSFFGNVVIRFLTRTWEVHEFTGSLRAYRSDIFTRIEKKRLNFLDNTFLVAFIVEAVRVGSRTREVPITFSDRRAGASKIDVPQYAPNLLRFCLKKAFSTK